MFPSQVGSLEAGHEGSGRLGGSWDLVTEVINKVTILISTYNPT